jgi:hypothetical protein
VRDCLRIYDDENEKPPTRSLGQRKYLGALPSF